MRKVAQTDFDEFDGKVACASKIERCVAANILTKVAQSDFDKDLLQSVFILRVETNEKSKIELEWKVLCYETQKCVLLDL